MPWNEPGGGRDPWSGRGGREGPPDLDEVVRRLQAKLSGLFGGGRGARGGGSGGGPGAGAWALIVIAGVAYLLWDIAYIIQPAQRGVVLRFGAYAATLDPGLNFRLPRPIEFVVKEDVDQIRVVSHKASMLTKDENIVEVELAVQYRLKSVTDYLFNARAPDATVRQATETSVREVIGSSTMDFVLSGEGRADIENRTSEHVQSLLDTYEVGLLVTDVNMQAARAPEEVKSAFDDAIKAREDEQRLINEAEAYRNEILPKARGTAARMLEEANAYKEQVVAQAQGETQRFEKLRVEFEKAPGVTRERLYLETMEEVLSASPKVLMPGKGSQNNLMYLPLDRLLERSGRPGEPAAAPVTLPEPAPSMAVPDDMRDRGAYRARESR